MTTEQKYLLQMMKCAVRGQRLTALPEGETPDWAALLNEACAQTVELLFFDVLTDLKDQLPQEFYQKAFEIARRRTASNMRVEFGQAQLVSVLEQMACPYVILKGETAATSYPVPELRLLGDVDFLVPREQTDSITEEMKKLGYQHSWEPGDYHQVLEKKGACLEMHMEIAGMPEGETRGAVQAYLSHIYEKSVLMDRGFGPFHAPCPEHQAMVLLLHMQHHVVTWGIGLRQIMDWACFVNKNEAEPFWQESLLPLLKKIGLFHFTAVVTKMTALHLGSVCPDWAAYVEKNLCYRLMEDILSGGNFGRKDKERKRAGSMLPDWEQKGEKPGKIKLLYGTLKDSVLHQNPELEKKPVQLFLKMTGKVGRYGILYCQGKRPNLWKAAEHADTRRSIYEQLRMFETEE